MASQLTSSVHDFECISARLRLQHLTPGMMSFRITSSISMHVSSQVSDASIAVLCEVCLHALP